MIGRRVGRYRVLAPLGEGGMARVWKAHDELLNRPVALKILDEKLARSDKSRRRFLHDAQAAAALSHPGVIAVHDYGEADETVYIALAFIDGETVSALASRRLMPFDEVVRIGITAADALAHAHERGVIHRDVTGRNLMVAKDGRVIMLDFGLALAAWESRVTTTETAMGTALYMAPELWSNVPAGVRSDIYGLGIVLYEMLTGTFPFDQPQIVAYASVNTPAVPLRERRPDVPADLEAVVNRAIARDPATRCESAADVAAALRTIGLGERSTAPRERVPGRPPDAPSRIATEDAGGGSSTDTARSAVGTPLYIAVAGFEHDAALDPADPAVTLAGRLGETVSCALAKTQARVVTPPDGRVQGEPAELAQRLGANAVLRGSVARNGAQVRVTYHVLDPWRGVRLAADVVDGSAMQVFEVEDRVVASVTRALGLAPEGTGRSSRRREDPVAHERYLQALGYLKRYDNEASVDGAIQRLEALIAGDDGVAAWHAALARACLLKHEHTKERPWESRAAAECERARALDLVAPETQVALGALRMSAGQYDEACEAFEQALAAHPDDLEAMLGLAGAHRAAGRIAEAERACREAIRHRSDDWRGHLLLGRVHYKAGEFARAIESYRRVAELCPDNAMGRRYLGAALYLLDRHEEAAEAFRQSLAIEPNDEAYANLGTILYYLGRLDQAVAACRKAVELAPTDPKRWGNLGSTCRWLPDGAAESRRAMENAVALMRDRLERHPTHAEWWAQMAGWLANLERRDEARAAIMRAMDLAPDNVHCMVRAGHVFFQLGDREECLLWLERARGAGYGTEELMRSREFSPLRDDPRFRKLLVSGTRRGMDGGDPQQAL